MHPRSTLVCDILVTQALSVRLTVSPSTAEAWIWTYFLDSGELIARGSTSTKVAAQVASQRAHEHWFYRNRKRLSIPNRVSYNWREVE
jgi:hypothetical protein